SPCSGRRPFLFVRLIILRAIGLYPDLPDPPAGRVSSNLLADRALVAYWVLAARLDPGGPAGDCAKFRQIAQTRRDLGLEILVPLGQDDIQTLITGHA